MTLKVSTHSTARQLYRLKPDSKPWSLGFSSYGSCGHNENRCKPTAKPETRAAKFLARERQAPFVISDVALHSDLVIQI
jgi:hypothetical protein